MVNTVEFRILGEVDVRVNGSVVRLGGEKIKTVLAGLLLAREKMVSDSRLAALLWGEDCPKTASAQIYTYVSRLRKFLGDGVSISRHRQGYTMSVRAGSFDYQTFANLSAAGAAELAGCRYRQASEHFEKALALYRESALGGVTEHMVAEQAAWLEEARMAAIEGRVEADLALGRFATLTPELVRLVADHPYREYLRAQLMFVLQRCGRQAEAVAVYHQGRRLLADELGIDPSRMLREVYEGIVVGEPVLPAQLREPALAG
jgi:SARP family transcriptional regulator, regulator of embCAB operon